MNERYDMIVDEGGDLIRVQCKTARLISRGFSFSVRSTNWNNGKSQNYVGQVDIFAVYVRENKKVYIFNVEKSPKNACSVRFDRKDFKNHANRFAEDHEFIVGKSLRKYN